jgi:Uma2 family endonuclease
MAAQATISPPAFETVAELLDRLGGVSPSRVRLRPHLGTATEKDVADVQARERRLYELVDGVLVEKVSGFLESYLAAVLIRILGNYVEQHDLGIVAGESGMMRLAEGLVRIPDVSFISWDRIPGRQIPRAPAPDLVPDLVVEVLSAGNTTNEMERKLHEYFGAGVRLVWYVDPQAPSVRVFTSSDQMTSMGQDGILVGGSVLPGFALSIREWFSHANLPGGK